MGDSSTDNEINNVFCNETPPQENAKDCNFKKADIGASHHNDGCITDRELQNYFLSLNAWSLNMRTLINSFPQVQKPQIQFLPSQSGRAFYECKCASLWKRFVAEFIDGFILFLVKFYLIVILHDGFNLTFDNYINYLENPTLFFNFTTEIAAVELISRLLIFTYESYFLYTYGATPGKKIMGLKVFTVESVLPIPGRTTVSVWPCKPLGWWQALLRTVLKNIGILVFPISYGFVVTNYSRAAYDYIVNTFVIDISQYPIRLLNQEHDTLYNLNQERL